MRRTFSQLIQDCKNNCIDDKTSSQNAISDPQTFFKTEINNAITYMASDLMLYKNRVSATATTADGTIYYAMPAGMNSIETATYSLNGISYLLKPIQSQEEWDRLQMVDFTSATVPLYIFPRGDSFGIYPTPSDAYTITIVGNYYPQIMTRDDSTAGTITLAGSTAVVGSSTAFADWMVGAYLIGGNDGVWYKIESVTNSTNLVLSQAYTGVMGSSISYRIGQSPNIPNEFHEFISARVASKYYAGYRADIQSAQGWMNYFYTGDFNNTKRTNYVRGGYLGIKARYAQMGRNNSAMVQRNRGNTSMNEYQEWGTVLSE